MLYVCHSTLESVYLHYIVHTSDDIIEHDRLITEPCFGLNGKNRSERLNDLTVRAYRNWFEFKLFGDA